MNEANEEEGCDGNVQTPPKRKSAKASRNLNQGYIPFLSQAKRARLHSESLWYKLAEA